VVPDRHIREAIERLSERGAEPNASSWVVDDSRRSIAVLQAFLSHGKLPELERHDFRTISGTFPHLMIDGVSVSVAISATVHRTARDGTKSVGGLSLFISKAMTASEGLDERAAVAALLCHMFAEERLGHLGKPDHKLCLVMDVAAGRLYPAPKGQLMRRKNIALACAEIARAWPTVTPPNDYDGPELWVGT
jgi:hypothetical protein